MKLCFEQRVAAPRQQIFTFHTDPANLATLLEGWAGFELGAHAGHIRPGVRVELVQRAGLLRWDFTFEHVVLESPLRHLMRAHRRARCLERAAGRRGSEGPASQADALAGIAGGFGNLALTP